jgi:hypothetical protein
MRLGLWLLIATIGTCPLLAQEQSTSRAERFASLPDWTGYWISAEPIGRVDISGTLEFDPVTEWKLLGIMAPPYNEARQAERARLLQAGIPSGKALGFGYPYMMESPAHLQFLITPEETLILNFYRDIRHVYTDGKDLPLPEERWPSPWGDSVGHWDGDTLVITTVSVQRRAILDSPFPLISDDTVYTERIRMTGPDRLESEMTITDPTSLTEPWVVQLAYRRVEGMDRMFHLLFDNDRTVEEGDGLTIAPSRSLAR